MNIKLVCPECGKMNETDENHDVAFCIYCGAVIPNPNRKQQTFEDFEQPEEPKIQNQTREEPQHFFKEERKYSDANLIIDFSSSDPNAKMIISFNKLSTKRVIPAGQTAAMKIPLGHYVATMDLAGRSYTRELHIVEEEPVLVHAAAHGRREITIEQPSYELEEPVARTVQKPPVQQQPVRQQTVPQSNPTQAKQANITSPVNNAPAKATTAPHPLSIVSFILSLSIIGSLVGLVLGIISLAISNQRKKVFGVLGTIFGGIVTLISFIIIIALIAAAITSDPELLESLNETTQEAIKIL